MDVATAHDATSCPYCRSGLRRVPGLWLGRGGFECDRCGEFVDFSRSLGASDDTGTVSETSLRPERTRRQSL